MKSPTENDERFMRRALELARNGVDANVGGPFGAVVVKDGRIVGEGVNRVTSTNDPTAHAEVVAIRAACTALRSFQLDGCVIYSTCEPCPMCLGAIYWARPARVFIAGTRDDAAAAGFDDAFIYAEICSGLGERSVPMESLLREEARAVFEQWIAKPDKISY